jgi:hypothetical protein
LRRSDHQSNRVRAVARQKPVELIDELQEALQRVQADDRTRSEIGELAETPEKLLTKLSGFLISWAMPAVS